MSTLRVQFAGSTAILAGTAWIAWAVINIATHGGLDIGPPAIGARLALVGQLLTVAFNLLLIPAALIMWRSLGRAHPYLAAVVSACGVSSLVLWAYGVASQGITLHFEVTYLALSGIWWCGIGATMLPYRRFLGAFTIILGAFALWDSLLTSLWPVPLALYLTAAPKLPLSMAWDFLIGVSLWRARRG